MTSSSVPTGRGAVAPSSPSTGDRVRTGPTAAPASASAPVAIEWLPRLRPDRRL